MDESTVDVDDSPHENGTISENVRYRLGTPFPSISSQLHSGYSHAVSRSWQSERQLTKVDI